MELFGFGPHLMIEGTHAASERLGDLAFVRDTLESLPRELEMTVVLEPHVSSLEGFSKEHSGITGVVMIAESHISIHTFPHKNYLYVDIFSAKEFDVQRAVSLIVERFEVGRYETHLTNRGKEFPKDLEQVGRIVQGEREYLEARLG